MKPFILDTGNYTFRHFEHIGFGGNCKYIAIPKKQGLPKLLVKHQNVNSACNEFMFSRIAELLGVYVPTAYLLEPALENSHLFALPFIVGIEYIEDFQKVDYPKVAEDPFLRQTYLSAMALYALFSRLVDTPQFAYLPSKGITIYDNEEAFGLTDFLARLMLLPNEISDNQVRIVLSQLASSSTFDSDAEICLKKAAKDIGCEDTDILYPPFLRVMEAFCRLSEDDIVELTDVIADFYPMEFAVYYEEYIKILKEKVAGYLNQPKTRESR